MRLVRILGSIALATVALAACKGGSGHGGGAVPTTRPSSSPGTGTRIYVANSTIDTVTGYFPQQAGQAITISSGVSSPVALAVDTSGNLFVDNCQPCIPSTGSTSTITVYARGSGSPSRTISAGLSQPVAMALASNGTLYVANQLSSTVTAYAKGSSSVAMTITNGVAKPDSIAVDSSGNIYVGNGAFFPGTVTVYSSSGSLLRTLPAGAVEDVAVDSTGRVYVSNCNVTCSNGSAADSVIVFAANSTSVAYVVTSGLSFPTYLALDSKNDLYVANNALGTANNVVKYAAGGTGVTATIAAPGPSGLAIDKNDVVYIPDGLGPGGASYDQLSEYVNGSIFTVTTGITSPLAVAVSTAP